MRRTKPVPKQKKSPPRSLSSGLSYVTISNRMYGNQLKGARIYYEGARPTNLQPDGRMQFGKHILEILRAKFGDNVRWIITKETDAVEQKYGVTYVRTSRAMLKRIFAENIELTREIKKEIVQRRFYNAFPSYFTTAPPSAYIPGAIAKLLRAEILKKLSSADKEAINAILPAFLKAESVSALSLKAVEIETLRQLADDFRKELTATHAESWWQNYIQARILIMQQGYIRAIEKMNVAVGNTKFPDFALVTHDNYLDILEIKKPDTPLLKEDASRGNFHWDAEIARAIIQVENYLEQIMNRAGDVRSFIKDKYGIDLKVVRPRGFILAGKTDQFQSQKERDDFRLLSHGLKNVTVITYDELLTRLENHLHVLEQFSGENTTPAANGSPARQTNRTEGKNSKLFSGSPGQS